MAYEWCPCCTGQTQFDWYEEACDECAVSILNGIYTESAHRHAMSRDQLAVIAHGAPEIPTSTVVPAEMFDRMVAEVGPESLIAAEEVDAWRANTNAALADLSFTEREADRNARGDR